MRLWKLSHGRITTISGSHANITVGLDVKEMLLRNSRRQESWWYNQRYENDVKLDLMETGYQDGMWMELAQERIKW
jgi:hypothetical protein